ncbi:hypothetical protein [Mucilaginibacter sp. L3T2-6]|uniref:hypothetical protein n=1 Tax=Mucilaginibacter sp. L3T2-6 TaxID=3062491 RepID=UPI002674536A|nr:hypothetical protein [Mucilaginibacter sp. L3T2-6]MDO3641977.1 hypothetical protein [Mucilaginibacter sp. L3T2-6]MDV6214345.1 hypothetical protein [Mucilaginibacter sp. L3T2-6]
MNSPWGIEINILKELHWTRHYLLWRIPWPHVQLMLADAPRFKTGKTEPKGRELESLEDFEDFLKL